VVITFTAFSGLAGYFEAILYNNIGLSIHPQYKDRVSKNMLSWFPLFFPFRVRTWKLICPRSYLQDYVRNPSTCRAIQNCRCRFGESLTIERSGMNGMLSRSCLYRRLATQMVEEKEQRRRFHHSPPAQSPLPHPFRGHFRHRLLDLPAL
jgi:hypothetical protein